MARGRAGGLLAGVAAMVLAAVACHPAESTRRLHPRAVVDRAVLDFGDVPVGEWRDAEVRIRNVGFVPFNALEVLGLSNNPSFVVEMDPGKVGPRDEKVVRVRFHPLSEGELTEELRVYLDAEEAETPVLVRGMGAPLSVPISPARLDFETLEADSDRILPLTITNPVDVPLSLRVVGPGGTPFSTRTLTVPPNTTLALDTRYFPRVVGTDVARLEVRPCETCTPSVAELAGTSVEDAFAFAPDPLYFPETPVHARSEGRTRATNITWRPVRITELLTSDESFEVLATLGGQEVAPGGGVEVPMAFAARTAGPLVGHMEVRYQSDRARAAPVPLDATGGQPSLAAAPVMLDLGELPVGGKVDLPVRLTNSGQKGELRLTRVTATGDWTQFGVLRPQRNRVDVAQYVGGWPDLTVAAPSPGVAPGNDSLEVRVFFEPTVVGEFAADITFWSDAPYNAVRTVRVTGRSYPVPACAAWAVTPLPTIDFGNVPLGWGAVLGFHFRNTGTGTCAVKDIRLGNDGGGAFFMPGGALTGGVVPPGWGFSAQVAFRAPAAGTHAGELVMTVNDPATPAVRVPLVGHALGTCLTASPNYMDFGAVRYDCAPPPRRTLVSNQCAVPITVTGVSLGNGTSDQFSLTEQPVMPLMLQPGQGFELAATYSRTVHDQHFTPLYVHAVGEPVPLLVPLLAETNHVGLQEETFVQGADSQLDVLLVLGNTTTMGAFLDRLRADVPGWLAVTRAQGLDVRVGVTTTGLVSRPSTCAGPSGGGEAGRLVPVDGARARVVDGNGVAVLQQNVLVGTCHDLTQGLETVRQALGSPLVDRADDPRTALVNDGNLGLVREPAALAVVMLTDEDDHSGFPVESYVQFLRSLKGPGGANRTRMHALVPVASGLCRTAGPTADRVAEVARQTGGEVRDICEGSYRGMLDGISAGAVGPQQDFHLAAVPTGLGEMTVTVDGVPSNAWQFDGAVNAVVFDAGSVPSAGQRITVRYRSVCGG